ncbi:MAG TPA: FliH/SctL family protein [Thermodesulfobacteriota bacterium]|nr:FliH/SctL family protein [Thermodesulfobacteriota bacterium]
MSRIFKRADSALNASPMVFEFIGSSNVEDKDAGCDGNVGGDLVTLEKEAYEKGFAAGEKAGFDLGVKKAEVLFGGLARILDELSDFKTSLYGPCEKEMVELALAIARKVVHREVEKKDSVLDCVRVAIKSVVAAGEILIKVNPKDLEVLNNHKTEFARFSGTGVKGLKIEADPEIDKGGCVIETNYGEIDSRIGSVLSDIEERLLNG